MIDLGILITGGVGVLTTIASGWTSWFFARKKYNTEVDFNEIENLKKSLEFYESIVKDNNKKLQFYIDMSEANRVEVYRLKGIVHRLLNNSCLNSKCLQRMYYTEDQIKDILGGVAPYSKMSDTDNDDSDDDEKLFKPNESNENTNFNNDKVLKEKHDYKFDIFDYETKTKKNVL